MPRQPKKQTSFLKGLKWMGGEPLVQTKTRSKLGYEDSYSSRLISELKIRRGRK